MYLTHNNSTSTNHDIVTNDRKTIALIATDCNILMDSTIISNC